MLTGPSRGAFGVREWVDASASPRGRALPLVALARRRTSALVYRIAVSLFLIQAGFHAFTASLPLALARGGKPDAEIGLIVGVAAVVQIPAAFGAGALVDRFGGLRLMLVGGAAYIAACLVLLLPGVEATGPNLPFLVARLLQGIGIGTALPAGLSLVPRLVPAARRGFALAVAGASHNLTLVVLPPASLVVLDLAGLDGVALVVLGLVLVGLVVAVADPSRADGRWSRAVRKAGGAVRSASVGDRGEVGRRVPGDGRATPGPVDPGAAPARRAVEPDGARSLPPARRLLGVAYRPTWSAPLAIVLLFVAHWGVVTAYLPQRAEAAGANIGLFFAADGIAVLLMRVPSGWLADRFAALPLVLAGIAITAAGVALLLLPPATPLLVVAGIATGGGAALIVTPLLLELTRRSSEADRGSAFALFSAGFAAAIALGSIGAAPIVAGAGFEVAVAVAMIGLGLAAAVAVLDGGLRLRVRAAGG